MACFVDEKKNARIVMALRAGNTLRDACAMAAVPYPTCQYWRLKGRKGDEPYATLFAAQDEAMAEARARACTTIVSAATGWEVDDQTGEMKRVPTGYTTDRETGEKIPFYVPDWRAAMAFLEKRDWQNYDQRAVVGHIAAQAARDANLSELKDAQLLDKLERIVRLQARKSPEFAERIRAALDDESDDEEGETDAG